MGGAAREARRPPICMAARKARRPLCVVFDTTYGLCGSSYAAAFAARHLPGNCLFGAKHVKV